MNTPPPKPRILVIGGYGVFGGRLTRRLAQHSDVEVIVAGRRLASAKAHCLKHGGMPAEIDTSADLDASFAKWRPTVVVDAAGPFQSYAGDAYHITRAAIRNNAHYLDLADDTTFVAGIGAVHEAAANAGRVALSGCSSVPAISSAAVNMLKPGLAHIETIESVIVPGNRAPRGASVVAAILSQVGKPITVWQAGVKTTIDGWCRISRTNATIDGKQPLGWRFVSPIGAPDLQLFPQHFLARTVRFRAGLELSFMHLGLAALAYLVRWRLLKSATPLTAALLRLADWLKPFGSDRGAMTVDVIGRTTNGNGEQRRYTILAEAGDGPEIPSTPAYVLALRLCREPHSIQAGARPCLDDLTIADIEEGLASFAIASASQSGRVLTVFEGALQEDYKKMPSAIRDLHDVLDVRAFVGTSRVERGRGLLSRLIGWSMGFPPAAEEVDVQVDMQRTPTGEHWTRRFGRAAFRSHLSVKAGQAKGQIWERFGPLSCRISLQVDERALHFPVDAVRLFGVVPLPGFLLPTSQTREFVDDTGAPCFDVRLDHPLAGFIVRYQGRLQAIDERQEADAV